MCYARITSLSVRFDFCINKRVNRINKPQIDIIKGEERDIYGKILLFVNENVYGACFDNKH